MIKVARNTPHIYVSENQLDRSKTYFDMNGFLSEYNVANILVIYRHPAAFCSVPNHVNVARIAAGACIILGINPQVARIDAVGAYSRPSRAVPTLPSKEEEEAMQNQQAYDKSHEPGPVRSFTGAISWLLSLPGLSVLVLQGNDTLSANWSRLVAWMEHQDPDTLVVFAFHVNVAEANHILEDLCQVCSKWMEHAIFSLRDVIDFEQGRLNCSRVRTLKTCCLARQDHKDRQLQQRRVLL